MAELLYRIGWIAARRRLTVLAIWVAILAVAVAAFAAFGKTPSSDISIPGTPTAVVTEHLAASMPGTAGASGTVVFSTRDGAPFTGAQKAAITAAVARGAEVDGVTRVVDPFAVQAETDAQTKQIAVGLAQIDAARARLADGQKQLDAAKTTLADGQQQLDAGKAQLATRQQQLDAAKAAPGASQTTLARLAAQQQQLDATAAQFAAKQRELDAGAATIGAKQAEIDAGAATIEAQSRQLEAGATLLELASRIRMVSEDGSTAIAPVMCPGPA